MEKHTEDIFKKLENKKDEIKKEIKDEILKERRKTQGKIIIVGDGAVGSSFAYTLVAQNIGREIGIIDINKEKVIGDCMDLSNAVAYTRPKKVFAADYSDCKDAEIVAISAGVPQKKGETRMDLLKNNIVVFESIIKEIVDSGFKGIFLIATNPVDVLTYATWKISGFPKNKVIGTGTTLDTARLRREIAEKFNIDTRNVHGYILGEHGDTEFPCWSQTNIAGVSLKDWISLNKEKTIDELNEIFEKVKNAAYEIINRKGATYYGIAMSMAKICKTILNDSGSILPVSSYLNGKYGLEDIFIGVPAIIDKNGVRDVVEIKLSDDEKNKMFLSAKAIKDAIKQTKLGDY